MNKIARLFNKILIGMGLREKKKKVIPPLWQFDQPFQSLYAQMKDRTLVTIDRCFMVYQWAKYASAKEGDFAEVGVFKGGTAYLTANTVPQKKFYLFDTFLGMPETHPEFDFHKKGEFAQTSIDSVKEFLKPCRNIEFRQGFFPQTTKGLEDKKFSFVHIDVDIYQSVKDGLEFFYPRLVPGGVMIFDDYQWKDCPGVEKAINEFLKNKKEKTVISALYQCILIH